MSTVVILDNIRSAHNVGSIFRTADGSGVEKIYLVGTTPNPIDRFGRVQPEIAKTSLGASESVEWEHVGIATERSGEEAAGLLTHLQAEGYQVVVVEQTLKSIPFYKYTVAENVAYVFGAEVEGVQPALIAAADQVIEIPMQGMLARNRRPDNVGKESLNVSVTAGVILFRG